MVRGTMGVEAKDLPDNYRHFVGEVAPHDGVLLVLGQGADIITDKLEEFLGCDSAIPISIALATQSIH